MIKKVFYIIILLFSTATFAQDLKDIRAKASKSSDSELTVFIKKAKDNGLTLTDAEKQFSLLGGKPSELKKLRDLWDKDKELPSVDPAPSDDSSIIKSEFGETEIFTIDDDLDDEIEIQRFGRDFFTNENIIETPQLFVATPNDYRLGPGDELEINLFGASEISYSVQISRNGNIKLDRMDPIYLSGLSIRSASSHLKSRLSKIYIGLNSKDPIEKVDLELNLKKARSIVVNITGQVEAPGTYTISGFSSVLNALYAAGGPNKIGTYRDIKIIRNGKTIHSVDLYDYFANGSFPNIYLRDQDVILVKTYEAEIELSEGFKQSVFFEVKKNENIEDLLNISGGPSANAFRNKIFIERFYDFSKKIVEVDKDDFSNNFLVDGDKISFKLIKDENISDLVKIGGAVNLEGDFQLNNNKTVKDLINSAGGFSADLLGNNAILYRYNNGLENSSISINLNDNISLSTSLFQNDSLYVPTTKDILLDLSIEINGEVNFPKEINYRFGLTIPDLINLSGGLTPYANKKDIRIYRNISTQGTEVLTEEIFVELDENLKPNKKIILQPDDIVTVNTFSYRRENKFYEIQGEVALPGLYSIKKQNYSVYDAINDNVEFLRSSSIEGISIIRDSIQIPVFGKKLIEQGSNSKFNFELFSGDKINVPKKNNTVIISGEVQQEGIINIFKPINAKFAIESAGGFTSKSVKKEVYVKYQNGLKRVTKNFLFFKLYPKAFPGSIVIVPKKDESLEKTSVGDIVGFTTSLVSIIALIKSF